MNSGASLGQLSLVSGTGSRRSSTRLPSRGILRTLVKGEYVHSCPWCTFGFSLSSFFHVSRGSRNVVTWLCVSWVCG